jgi:glycosyltransferase involved in cell wall biosynthesis
MARLAKSHPEAKLLFLGSAYPDGSGLGQGRRYQEAVAEAKRLGLMDRTVFFREQWLPHDAVVEYLQAADIAVTTYFTNAETRFAHRTRFMDFIWAGVPLVCTEGDVLAEEVSERGWGVAVKERDEDGLVAALTRLLEDEAFAARCRANLSASGRELSWESAFRPLVAFLREPRTVGEPRSGRRGRILGAALSYGGARVLERLAARLAGGS